MLKNRHCVTLFTRPRWKIHQTRREDPSYEEAGTSGRGEQDLLKLLFWSLLSVLILLPLLLLIVPPSQEPTSRRIMHTVRDDTWLRARRAFLPFDEVVGVGYGPKLKDGKIVAHQAIIVFVDRKLPASKVRKGQSIPETFDGLPTDVRVPDLVPGGTEHGASQPVCLPDYQWIDWGKIHRRRTEPQRTQRTNIEEET